ncbi:MAG: hypothetical protein RLY14_80 [Planctomycetota bacterium]|jgi:hypothetical protein
MFAAEVEKDCPGLVSGWVASNGPATLTVPALE